MLQLALLIVYLVFSSPTIESYKISLQLFSSPPTPNNSKRYRNINRSSQSQTTPLLPNALIHGKLNDVRRGGLKTKQMQMQPHLQPTTSTFTTPPHPPSPPPSPPLSTTIEYNALYAKAKALDVDGDKKSTLAALRQLHQINPNDFRVVRRMSRLYVASHNTPLGKQVLETALKTPLGGRNAYLWLGLASIEQSLGDLQKARLCYRKAISLDPALPNVYHAWSRLESSEGNLQRAAVILRRGLKTAASPNSTTPNHRLYHALGDLLGKLGRYDEASRMLSSGFSHAPEFQKCFLHSSMGMNNYMKGDVAAARESFEKAIRSNHKHSQAWLSLARLEELEGNVEEARAVYKRANKAYRSSSRNSNNNSNNNNNNNNNKHANNNFSGNKWVQVFQSWARFEQLTMEDGEAAVAIYSIATLLFPTDTRLLINWGKLEADNKRELKAREILAEAVKKGRGREKGLAYRVGAELEMDLQQYERARALYALGVDSLRKMTNTDTSAKDSIPMTFKFKIKDGLDTDPDTDASTVPVTKNLALAQLLHGWALCEFSLGNVPRAKKLFALALKNVKGSLADRKFEAAIFLSMAIFEKGQGSKR